jgi:phosphoribosylformylglycinamidine (FGAM) synthase-like enzyme
VKRFHRKRKAPATRSNPVKIQKKDVNLAAETLLELSTTALHDALLTKYDPSVQYITY